MDILKPVPKPLPDGHMPQSSRAGVTENTRNMLYRVQSGICHYCKRMVVRADWSIDHMLPKCRGGTNTAANRIGACKNCNQTKSFLTEEEFMSIGPGSVGFAVRARSLLSQLHKSGILPVLTTK
jgi:hypothetical protein